MSEHEGLPLINGDLVVSILINVSVEVLNIFVSDSLVTLLVLDLMVLEHLLDFAKVELSITRLIELLEGLLQLASSLTVAEESRVLVVGYLSEVDLHKILHAVLLKVVKELGVLSGEVRVHLYNY